MKFEVKESGWYLTRDLRLAEIMVNKAMTMDPVIGYIVGEDDYDEWGEEGNYIDEDDPSGRDLVKYLGKERPVEKKVVRTTPLRFGENLPALSYNYLARQFERWIHLYDDGTIDVDGDVIAPGRGHVESRKIKWETGCL